MVKGKFAQPSKSIKIIWTVAPDAIKEVFGITETLYNLPSAANHFQGEKIRTTHYGIHSVRHLGPKYGMMQYPTILGIVTRKTILYS